MDDVGWWQVKISCNVHFSQSLGSYSNGKKLPYATRTEHLCVNSGSGAQKYSGIWDIKCFSSGNYHSKICIQEDNNFMKISSLQFWIWISSSEVTDIRTAIFGVNLGVFLLLGNRLKIPFLLFPAQLSWWVAGKWQQSTECKQLDSITALSKSMTCGCGYTRYFKHQ